MIIQELQLLHVKINMCRIKVSLVWTSLSEVAIFSEFNWACPLKLFVLKSTSYESDLKVHNEINEVTNKFQASSANFFFLHLKTISFPYFLSLSFKFYIPFVWCIPFLFPPPSILCSFLNLSFLFSYVLSLISS